MKTYFKLGLISALILTSQSSLAVNTDKGVLDFFNQYQLLEQRYDPKLADLISDDAWLVVTTYDEDSEFINKTKASKFKKVMVEAMQFAKASFSTDKYSNVRIKDLGNQQYLISADRYSIERCYLDKEFTLTVKKKDKTDYTITHLTTSKQADSKCTTSINEDLPAKIQAIASMQSRDLPQQIFRGLEIEKIYAEGLNLNYQARLVYANRDELDPLKIQMELEPLFTNNACSNKDIKKELEKGMTLTQTILSKDNQQVFYAKLDKNSCHSS